MDLQVRITMTDELTDSLITSSAYLDLASGDINRVEYDNYDVAAKGPPCDLEDYEFTSGTLSHNGKDVEFRVDVNKHTGQHSVSASELLEIKVRAAALFAGIRGQDMLGAAAPARSGSAGPPVGRKGRLH